MKTTSTITAVLLTTITLLLTIGCASTGGISSYGMGDDAIAMATKRGSRTAQISHSQGIQFERQQDLTSREIDLQQKKQQATHDSINQGLGTAVSIARTIGGLAQMLR